MKLAFACAAFVVFAAFPVRAEIDMNALYEAAKKEGAVNIYGGGPKQPYLDRAARFEKQFPGIKVNFVNGPSNVLSERIDKARQAGKPEADVALLQTIQDFVAWKKAGVLLPFKFDAWDLIPASFKDAEGCFSGHSLIMIAYAHRPDLAAVPFKTAKDILNPMFKGKVISTYPHLDDATLVPLHQDRRALRLVVLGRLRQARIPNGCAAISASRSRSRRAKAWRRSTRSASGNKVSTSRDPRQRAGHLVPADPRHLQGRAEPERRQALRQLVHGQGRGHDGGQGRLVVAASRRAAAARAEGAEGPEAQRRTMYAFITGDPAKLDALRARFKAISGEWSGVDVR